MAEIDQLQLVTFHLGEEEYGIDILMVHEIKRLKEIAITEVPRTPKFVEGIINLRGDVIPVIDLRVRFDLNENKSDKETRIIVVTLEKKYIGFLVDKVDEVINVSTNDIDLPPNEIVQVDTSFIQGIAKYKDRLVIILDVHSILTKKEEIALETIVNID